MHKNKFSVATSTIDLLKTLEKSHPEANNIYVLMDNAKYHFADIVREYAKNSKIKLVPLPVLIQFISAGKLFLAPALLTDTIDSGWSERQK